MSFATLAVISLVAIVGPLLALPRRWHLPIRGASGCRR
jgi:hypothetical protein